MSKDNTVIGSVAADTASLLSFAPWFIVLSILGALIWATGGFILFVIGVIISFLIPLVPIALLSWFIAALFMKRESSDSETSQ